MSIGFTTIGSGLTRAGAFVSNAADWTRTGWFTPTTNNPSGGNYRTYFSYGDIAFSNPYIWCGSNVDTGDIFLVVWDGSSHFTAGATVAVDAWFSWALTYNSTSHALKFYVNAALVATLTITLSGIAFVQTDEYAATDTTSWTNIAVSSLRSWQVELNLTALLAEWASTTPVVSGSLLAATPLTGPTDLADTSGNGRNWTAIGAAATTVAEPYPANYTALTATDVGSTPATVTQAVDIGGVFRETWFKYTAPSAGMLALWMYGTVDEYAPSVRVYLAPGTTTQYMAVGASPSAHTLTEPMQFPVRAAETYLFKASASGTVFSPSILTVHLETFTPIASIPRESIAINDDAGTVPRGDGTFDTFPLALLSSTADYTSLRYIPSFPSGETGDCLNDGTSLVGNDNESDTPKLYVFDANLTQLAVTDISAVCFSLKDIRANRLTDKFFMLYQDVSGAHRYRISRVSALGAIEATTSAIGTAGHTILCIATSPDDTVAYYVDNTVTAAIRRWDLVNDVALSDLVVVNANFSRTIVCLSDGSVVAVLQIPVNEIRRYSAAGALLNSYTAASIGMDFLTGPDSRLAQSLDSLTFWYRNLINGDAVTGLQDGKMVKVDADSGSVLLSVLGTVYTAGDSLSGPKSPSALPTLFGYSESCTFWVLPVGIGTPSNTVCILVNCISPGCPANVGLLPVLGPNGCADQL